MATDKKISTLVQSQVPGYLLEEGPNLVAFLKAYYEWMETTGQVTDASKNLQINKDIDTTNLDKFYAYFKKEVLADFPDAILADKRLVAKRIKDLYRSKGSAASYNLLFRILFDQNVSIYKPSENILRASDGRWTQDTLVRLGAPFTGNLEEALGEIVTGQKSGATGKILRVITVFESGVEVKQLRLVEVTGTFEDLEQVLTSSGLGGFVVNTIGPLKDVTFGTASTTGGAGHQVGDAVRFTSATGVDAVGVIDSTVDEVIKFTLVNGGSGYSVGNTVTTVSGGTPKGGLTGSVTVTAVSNTETILAFTDRIQGLSDTPIEYGPTYSSNSGIISSNLASSNSSTTLGSALGTIAVVTGTISAVDTVDGNYIGAKLPVVSAIDSTITELDIPDGSGGFKGRNAVISAAFVPGSISDVTVTNGGRLYNAIDSVTVTNTTRSATDAIGDPVVSGVINETGNYKGTKGFLSWDQRLQDNYYYQEFSYVLRSNKALKTYRDVVRDVIHPAGTKLFGQVDIENIIQMPALDAESVVTTNLIGGKFGIPSIGPNTIVSNNAMVSLSFNIPSIAANTVVSNPIVYSSTSGFVRVSNVNVISHYLTKPVTGYLIEPVLLGTRTVVQGDGADTFSTFLSGGTQIEIEDRIPGATGNTTYIVNTVYSNTTFTINSNFAGDSMANGVFRYT